MHKIGRSPLSPSLLSGQTVPSVVCLQFHYTLALANRRAAVNFTLTTFYEPTEDHPNGETKLIYQPQLLEALPRDIFEELGMFQHSFTFPRAQLTMFAMQLNKFLSPELDDQDDSGEE